MDKETENIKIPYLCLTKLDKYFGHTKALQKMDLDIYLGEIIGLVGPNGAGKSTLIKIITGLHEPTGGDIIFNSKDKMGASYNTNSAKAYGIACAYQELSLCTNLTVYENFIINYMNHKPFAMPGWRKKAKLVAKEYMEKAFPGNGVDVNSTVSDLSLAQKQMVEIAKAMSYKGIKILILDEPTSSLTGDWIKQLHISMSEIAKKGVAIIYISHKLDEIEKVCDRVVVMKEGTTCWKGRREDTSMNDLVEILGGKIKAIHRIEKDNKDLPLVVEIKDLNTKDLHNINMNVRQGEIIGISGLAGSGQKELILEIFKSSKTSRKSPSINLKTNTAYISGDRTNEGIFPLWDIADNMIISSLEQVTRKGFIIKEKLRKLAKYWYDKLKFIALGIHDDITNLSGGNQQKAMLARGLEADAALILLNDPTCGVDIETKQEMYKLLDEAKSQGKSIILHSTEDLEMEQCDRVYIMHEGKIIEELVGKKITVNNIITVSFKEKSKDADHRQTEKTKNKQQKVIISKIISNRAFLAIVTLLTIYIVNSILNPRILTYMGTELLFSSAVPLIFMALSQMFIVISGGIDFGSAQALGLMNVIIAFKIVDNPGLGIIYIILFVLGYAALGAIIHLTKIPAIIITLGASFIWLGLALRMSPTPGGMAPLWLASIYKFHFPLIPMPIVIAILAGLLAYWIVRKSKYGIIINGFGNNPSAITRAGWSQLTAMIVTYAISGLFIVIAGFMLTAISNSGDANATRSYSMLSFATIILGGCQFVGGIGSPIGVVAAALAISSISALLTFMGIDSNLQSAVTGLILIIALTIKLVSSKLEAKR